MTILSPMEGVTAPRRAAYPAAPANEAVNATTALIDHDDRPRPFDDDAPLDPFAAQAGRDRADGERAEQAERAGTLATARPLTPSRRHDGWTPDRQRAFLDHVAQGVTIGDAARLVGLSAASAYAFRTRAAGAAFAVGWQGALLLQRNRLVDDLTTRAFHGQTDIVTRDDGSRVQRHRHDNRLAMALLTRLDRIATADLPDHTGDARAARLAAQDWDRYLDLIGADASAAQAGLFLALRVTEGEAQGLAPITALARADLYRRTGAGHPAEIDVADLDPARRETWTAEQWTRAEAAGLVALAPQFEEEEEEEEEDGEEEDGEATDDGDEGEDGDGARGNPQLRQRSAAADAADGPAEPTDPVWVCPATDEWRTRFPPPPGFDGYQYADFGHEEYERALTPAELHAQDTVRRRILALRRAIESSDRDRWFEARAAAAGPYGEGLEGEGEAPPLSPAALELALLPALLPDGWGSV